MSAFSVERESESESNTERLTRQTDGTKAGQLTESEQQKIRLANIVGDIIAKSRLANNYLPYSKDDQKKAVKVWLEIFLFHELPPDVLNYLFLRARARRAQIIAENANGNAPVIDADFVAAEWYRGGRKVWFEKTRKGLIEKKQLYGCPECFGNESGRKWIFNESGRAVHLSKEICLHENYKGEE